MFTSCLQKLFKIGKEMKHLLLLSLFLVVSCAGQKPVSTPIDAGPETPVVTPPIVVVPPVEEPKPELPVVVEPKPVYTADEVQKIIDTSSCSIYGWGNRGKAPKGYLKAITMTFAGQVCNPSPTSTNSKKGASDRDVATHYGFEPSLVNVYALLIGSGMRESSGKQCTGVDESASNYASNTAEAGLFQTSYNAFLHPYIPSEVKAELELLMNSYLAGNKECFSWSTCTTKNYGSGRGLEFQKLAKNCPAFSAEAHAILMRVLYRHYGPLINKAAELRPECVSMLTKVQELVKPTCK